LVIKYHLQKKRILAVSGSDFNVKISLFRSHSRPEEHWLSWRTNCKGAPIIGVSHYNPGFI